MAPGERWGDPPPPGWKPGPQEDLKPLEPLELPLLEMARWKANNPFEAEGGLGETAFTLAETVALEVVGHFVEVLEPVAWLHLGYEVLHVVMGLGEDHEPAAILVPSASQLEAWNAQMWTAFWSKETSYPSTGSREAAFDRLVGGNASHGFVPKLSASAELKRQESIFEINARWLLTVEGMREAKRTLEHSDGPIDVADRRAAAEAREDAHLHVFSDPARAEQERQRAEFLEAWAAEREADIRGSQAVVDSYKADMKRVLEFEADPANWDLNKEERAVLPETWQQMFAERDALQARRDELAEQLPNVPAEMISSRQQMVAALGQADDALQRVKERMAAEASSSH